MRCRYTSTAATRSTRTIPTQTTNSPISHLLKWVGKVIAPSYDQSDLLSVDYFTTCQLHFPCTSRQITVSRLCVFGVV